METAPAHARNIDESIRHLRSDAQRGLSGGEVEARRREHGRNELAEAPPVPLWRRLAAQFTELVIWILLVAAIISGAIGEWIDAVVILAIVVLNGVIGFFQEERAGKALASLRKLSAPQCKVIREGQLQVMPARDLVPGDRIELEAGDNVPADARLISTSSVRAVEASLTGESVPAHKDAEVVLAPDTALGDRRNMVFMGTTLAAGQASAVVVATGMQTQLGQIAGLLHRHKPEPTPLQRRLAELGKTLIVVIFVIIAIIFVLHLLRGGELLDVFLLSVSLAVAAVPEGMPAVVTIALALGLQRMVKRNALIRKLPSVETLGSVTVICSDKTGTLTRNEMTVRDILAGEKHYRFTGAGYEPRGQFLLDGQAVDPRREPVLSRVLTIGAVCNHAQLRQANGDAWQIVGDPTEGALVVAARAAQIDPAPERLAEIPFDSDRKMMSVIARGAGESNPSDAPVMYTKGAPEVTLDRCAQEQIDDETRPLSDERRAQIMQENHAMAERALRVLGLAYRPDPQQDRGAGDGGRHFIERDLIFAGLVGMIDPPREEAKKAVDQCHAAGIRPVMITGDHPDTAAAIARELRIARPGEQVVTGQQLDRMSTDDLSQQVDQISVYARVSAAHKLQVVQAMQRRGEVVAMTGDGVNDAPAVETADIGIAMGITGTDVTKQASDMVLMDDNFASIVSAVEEGRGIFDNIQKFVHYLLSCNAGEILFMFFAALVGWPAPLVAIQILWINLVTDSLPALALGIEPPEPDIMRRRPRPPRKPVITLRRGALILFHGALIAAVTAVAFAWMYYDDPQNLDRARTVAFCTIAYAQLFFSFACRSQRFTMPQLGAFSNPQLLGAIAVSGLLQLGVVLLPFAQPLFKVTGTLKWEWWVVFALALTPVTVIELIKILRAQLGGRVSVL